MKKSLLAMAVLGAFAGAASAQSSITIYGVIDMSINNIKNTNAGDRWTMSGAGSQLSNRLGFRGQEDLGGGNFAGFNLETSVFPDNGQGGGYNTQPAPSTVTPNANTSSTPQNPAQLFDRIATVTLGSKSMGKISLGRDYTPAFGVRATYEAFNYVGIANYGTLFSSTRGGHPVAAAFGPSTTAPNTNVRANNSVAYYSPNIGGFSASLMGALGEGTTATGTGANKMHSGSVSYGAGPLYASAGYGVTKTTSVVGQDFKNWVLGASYNFGVVKVMTMLDQEKFINMKQRVFSLGVTAPVGPSGLVKAQYARSNVSGTTTTAVNVDNNDVNLFGIGYVHSLSKRTSLYTTVAQMKNKTGGTWLAVGGSLTGFPGVGTTTGAGGGKSTGYEIGVSHRF
ncbi:MAG: porin [Burkholderiales bacterium]